MDEHDENTEPGQEFRATILVDLVARDEQHAAELAWELGAVIEHHEFGPEDRPAAVNKVLVESVY